MVVRIKRIILSENKSLGRENNIIQSDNIFQVLREASQVVLAVKNPPARAEDIRDAGLIPGSGRFPWRRAWQPTPVFLPVESHRQRSLEGYRWRVTKSRTRLNWLSTHAFKV